MLIISRCITALLSTFIVLSWPLCAFAIWEYSNRTDPQAGEVLMILPGTGWAAGVLGIAIAIVVLLNCDRMSRKEKAIYLAIAASGAALFVVVFTLLILIDLRMISLDANAAPAATFGIHAESPSLWDGGNTLGRMISKHGVSRAVECDDRRASRCAANDHLVVCDFADPSSRLTLKVPRTSRKRAVVFPRQPSQTRGKPTRVQTPRGWLESSDALTLCLGFRRVTGAFYVFAG